MTFRFLAEDFDRYIKKGKPGDGVHNGRHIWDDLLDQLKAKFGVPFSPAAWKTHGDWLELLWLAPYKSPRGTWANQAQFFLSRSIQDKKLHFGLCIEFEPLKGNTSAASDRDGWCFLQQLQDENFARVLDALLTNNDWDATIRDWSDRLHSVAKNSAEIAAALGNLEQDSGWNVYIQKTLDASTVVAAGEEIGQRITDGFMAVRPLWEAVIPEADREYLYGRKTPHSRLVDTPPVDPAALFKAQLAQDGLYFTPWQLATFYTALQTKGFVILSGISGTGKTKLAQTLAGLLPRPKNVALLGSADPLEDECRYGGKRPVAYWWSYPIRDDVQPTLTSPFRVYIYNQGQITHVHTVSEFRTQAGGDQGMESPWPDITLAEEKERTGPSDHVGWKFKTWCKVVEVTKLGSPIALSSVNPLFGYENHPSALRNALIPIDDPQPNVNWLFIPVRPDWRDSKSLLGYYNPLTGAYEWTPFLRFLLRAVQSYEARNGLAWFVILDEMNLAHVEYYFADLLSVLESGRDEDGWTREPLRLGYPDEAEGDLPPRELKLPPNLYIVGTVNVDETTHAFSAKVLDRAFTLELTDVDFSTYLSAPVPGQTDLSDEERRAILQDFTRAGVFARIDKRAIAAHVTARTEVRARLQPLKDLLRPYDLHFAYRVFDEIVAFLVAAESNKLYDDQGGAEAAFDAAVLMKVLPKFHGSRSRLETPLCAVLAWCANPGAPDISAIRAALQEVGPDKTVKQAVMPFQFLYSRTAERVQRMLARLYTDGFAAFG